MRVAFLTCREIGGLTADDARAALALRRRGAEVEALAWDEPARWEDFSLVVLRSTWDYQERVGAFLEALEAIDRAASRLVNPLELVRWNLDKRYLGELASRGVPVVPSSFHPGLEPGTLRAIAREHRGRRFVIKPVVGASARDTFLLDGNQALEREDELMALYAGRPLLAQPFLEGVAREGEYSVSAFAGEASHAALKRPGAGDYRVQEEHGGRLHARPLDAELRAATRRVLDALPTLPAYARIDLVRDSKETLRLMELELVEPDLFLRLDAGAPERFAELLLAAAPLEP